MLSSQILPLLWIGDEYAASAPEVHAFGHVFNITIEVDKCSLFADDVAFQRFPIFDYGGEKQQQAMFNFFSDACSLIEQGVASGKPVLVHCVEGKQRSCAVVAAYLIHAMALTTSQAKDYIVQKRPEAFDCGAHVNFAPALERWEKTARNTATSSMEKNENCLPSGASSGSKGSKFPKTKNKTVPLRMQHANVRVAQMVEVDRLGSLPVAPLVQS